MSEWKLAEQVDRKEGRPEPGETRAQERPKKRTPVAEFRDVSSIRGKDPNYVYRGVVDTDANGARIQMFKEAGYAFVDPNTHQVGESMKFSSEKYGAIIRTPEGLDKQGNPKFSFYMRIRKDWYDADQQLKENKLRELEDTIFQRNAQDNPRDPEDFYTAKVAGEPTGKSEGFSRTINR